MGNDESVISQPRQKVKSVPSKGPSVRSRVSTSPLIATAPDKIRTTHLQCKWSQLYPSSIAPPPRMECFSTYVESKDVVICGYGKNSQEEYLNDIWAYSCSDNAWINLSHISTLPPRSGAKATFVSDRVYIFGGELNKTYFTGLHYIDANTMQVVEVQTENEGPCGRVGHVMASYDRKICIWGGFNDTILSDLWIYDLDTNDWTQIESNVPGRKYAASCLCGNLLYITCASNIDDMIVYNFDDETIDSFTVKGSPPQFELLGASLTNVGRYLILIGGALSNKKYAMVRAFDTVKRWWFVYYIVPDEETTTIADGGVDTNGIFLIPRMYGGFSVYRPSTRQIYMSLGIPTLEPPPIWVFNVGEGVSVLHQQLDLLDIFNRYIEKRR